MMNFFQTYIGFSGILVIVGLAVALFSYAGMPSKGSEVDVVSILGVVAGIILVIFGAVVWIAVWKLGQM